MLPKRAEPLVIRACLGLGLGHSIELSHCYHARMQGCDLRGQRQPMLGYFMLVTHAEPTSGPIGSTGASHWGGRTRQSALSYQFPEVEEEEAGPAEGT